MKIIISGHKGFLGSALVRNLQKDNLVIGISRNINALSKSIIEYSSNSISDIKVVPDVIVLCHASVASGNCQLESKTLFDSNVLFTSEIIKKFPNTYFLYVSSISVYGNHDNIITEKSNLYPTTEYAISKLWGEQIVKLTNNYGILRLTSLYGNDMKENTIVPNYVNQALLKNVINVWGNGKRKQNYLHVTDAVSYILLMINKKAQGIYIGASEKEYSNLELATIISNYLNVPINFAGSDSNSSVKIYNQISKDALGKMSEIKLPSGVKKYINWKQRSF
jgi:UDP-glucose 4-epimerase